MQILITAQQREHTWGQCASEHILSFKLSGIASPQHLHTSQTMPPKHLRSNHGSECPSPGQRADLFSEQDNKANMSLGGRVGQVSKKPLSTAEISCTQCFLAATQTQVCTACTWAHLRTTPQALGDKRNRCRREARAACCVWIISCVHMGSHFLSDGASRMAVSQADSRRGP